jgi:uncharacterized protein with von Willebrand factor type A (vWA) domain
MEDGPDAWLARLARSLRAEGIPCAVPETLAGRRALDELDLGDGLEVYFGLRAVFVSEPRHREAFDRCFWAAWGRRQRGREPGPENADDPDDGRAASDPPGAGGRDREPSVVERLRGVPGPGEGDAPPEEVPPEDDREAGGARFSPAERLSRRSFASLDRREIRAVDREMDRLLLKLATRRGRRYRPARKGRRPDLRRSFRSALAHHGEMLRLARRSRRVERPRVVLLCDVSGSMERYSRFLVRFLLSAGRGRDVETFVFGTRLTRLTRRISRSSVDEALGALSADVPDWSGGTRIGRCLRSFLDEHGRRLLGRRTVVVILSDGLDRGDVEVLEHAMRGIARRSRRVIWLNPLAGSPDYAPEARGMKAALPFVDELAPGHSLAALRELAEMIRL